MLAGHHFGRTARPFGDPRVVERRDDRVLLQRAGLLDGRLPEPQPAVQPRTRAAGGELRVARIERVVLREQLLLNGSLTAW